MRLEKLERLFKFHTRADFTLNAEQALHVLWLGAKLALAHFARILSRLTSNVRFPTPQQTKTSKEAKLEIRRAVASEQMFAGDAYNPIDLVNAARIRTPTRYQDTGKTPRPSRLIVTGQELHYTNVWLLSRFITPMGNIMPRWRTGLSPKKQQKLKKAIRKARQLGLLPYLHRYSHGPLSQAIGESKPNPLACPLESKKGMRNNDNRRRF